MELRIGHKPVIVELLLAACFVYRVGKELEGFYKSSDPIDVNYDESTARIILIYSVWSFFDS